MAKFCSKCGAPLKENTKFCSKCGAPVISQEKLATSGPAEEPVEEPVSINEPEPYHYVDPQPQPIPVSVPEPEPLPKKGRNKTAIILISVACVALLAIGGVVGFILLNRDDEETAANVTLTESNVIEEKDLVNLEKLDTETQLQSTPEASEEPQATPEATQEPQETPEAIEEPAETEANELVINEEYAAAKFYEYYASYIEAINHGGDPSYLKNPSDTRRQMFVVNYEKYNKGFTFKNLSFDVDKTDMQMRDLGNGKIEVTCHSYAVNVCTETSTGEVTDNRVMLKQVLEIDKATGDFLFLEQQSDNSHSFGDHEIIHCVNG